MKRPFHSTVAVAALGLLFVAAPALPHHSAAVAYDLEKYITLQGVVTEVKWENPHTWIYLDVKDAGGAVLLQDGRSFVIGASGTGPPSARPARGRSGGAN